MCISSDFAGCEFKSEIFFKDLKLASKLPLWAGSGPYLIQKYKNPSLIEKNYKGLQGEFVCTRFNCLFDLPCISLPIDLHLPYLRSPSTCSKQQNECEILYEDASSFCALILSLLMPSSLQILDFPRTINLLFVLFPLPSKLFRPLCLQTTPRCLDLRPHFTLLPVQFFFLAIDFLKPSPLLVEPSNPAV